jgi:hypothetical protein
MDLPVLTRAEDGPLSPAKRSVELKRRSIEPADVYVPHTSAPKLHCTFSAKLVDLMSNFSVVDGEVVPVDVDGSDCSEGAPRAPAAPARAAEDAEAGALAAAARAASAAYDDASSVVSEQGALEPVPEERAFTDDEAGSAEAPAGKRAASSEPSDDTALLPAAGGLAAVFEGYGARSIASAAPADVAVAVRAHLKEHPAVCLDTLYVYDLAQVARMHAAWVAALPRVRPYYGASPWAPLSASEGGAHCAAADGLGEAGSGPAQEQLRTEGGGGPNQSFTWAWTTAGGPRAAAAAAAGAAPLPSLSLLPAGCCRAASRRHCA